MTPSGIVIVLVLVALVVLVALTLKVGMAILVQVTHVVVILTEIQLVIHGVGLPTPGVGYADPTPPVGLMDIWTAMAQQQTHTHDMKKLTQEEQGGEVVSIWSCSGCNHKSRWRGE